ncbi:unnamed protein product [Tetraodon nigroviridis]|uniref:(spotted green pufferfish) hypothetical protein n=1 Tax=Tetraodon nigroviridis TaxID=99883 RepID=Q4S9T5_TETNG|nr:unnamed protein product [Tetraodon nigroviridis]
MQREGLETGDLQKDIEREKEEEERDTNSEEDRTLIIAVRKRRRGCEGVEMVAGVEEVENSWCPQQRWPVAA